MTETTCPRCSAPVSPQHRFCEQCGANLRWASVPCTACGSTDIGEDGFCQQCGRSQPVDRDRIELTVELPGSGAVVAGGVSDRGRKRQRNEDAMACLHTPRGDGLVVVAVGCDGVASGAGGDEAAQAAVRTASASLLGAVGTATDLQRATGEAVREAAGAVAALVDATTSPADAAAGSPSSTYVSAVITGDQVVVGWVGDSRAYWLGRNSSCLTTDHAMGGVLTRWLGADAGEVYPQVSVFSPDEPGIVLVCSDGLWNYLPEADELAAVALPGGITHPFAAATALTQRALDAGGRDNITVVLVPFPPPQEAP